jgi:hypothetical protein
MPNDTTDRSPVETSDASIALDDQSGEIVLERKDGEQPITIAGGALGPIASEHGAETDDETA